MRVVGNISTYFIDNIVYSKYRGNYAVLTGTPEREEVDSYLRDKRGDKSGKLGQRRKNQCFIIIRQAASPVKES